MSQSQLAEGIMTRENLSQIETGKQGITKEKLDLLLNRLGHGAKNFFPYPLSEGELTAFKLRDEFNRHQVNYDKDGMTRLIQQMEALPEFEESLHKQYLLKAKAIFCLQSEKNTQGALMYLKDAIVITFPNFRENMVHTYLLGSGDMEIISMIAEVEYTEGNHDKAVTLLKKLAESIRKKYVDPYERARSLAFVAFNLSNFLGQMKRYKEALALCNEAIEASECNQAFGYLPRLKVNKAYCLFYLGDKAEVKNLIYQAYYGCLALGQNTTAGLIKKHSWELFQIKIEC